MTGCMDVGSREMQMLGDPHMSGLDTQSDFLNWGPQGKSTVRRKRVCSGLSVLG